MVRIAGDTTGQHSQKMIAADSLVQWEFQDPRLQVPTIYKAYFSGLCKGISPQNMAQKKVLTYLQFRILEISHWLVVKKNVG